MLEGNRKNFAIGYN